MLPIGTMLHDTYRVEEYLSSGGFGNTYVVTNVQLGKRLAMKEFFMKGISQRDEQQTTVSVSNAENQEQFDAQLKKFKKEALRLHHMQNENIVQVHDLFEENGTAYYVMDLVDGESLSAKMKRLGRPLTESEVMTLLPQVLNALKGMHAQQIWHLDLKPGNIMVDKEDHAVLIDFGASKQMDASQGYTATSTAMCYTPGFAPTEQVDGNIKRVGPWTDFYALGATVYNLLTKQQPPSSSDITSDGVSVFRFPDAVSSEMRQLVVWMMNARPASRPQSVEAIEFRLSQMESDAEVTSINNNTTTNNKTTGPMVMGAKEKSKKGLVFATCGILAGLFLIACIGIGALFFYLSNRNFSNTPVEQPIYLEENEDSTLVEPDSTYYIDYPSVAEEDSTVYVKKQVTEPNTNVQERTKQEEDITIGAINYNQDPDEAERVMNTNGTIRDEVLPAADTKVFDVVEQMPQYPGGDAALMQFLNVNLRYPPIAEENGIKGRVVCQFVVECDGSISDVRVVRSVDPSLDKEAVRVIKAMPKWSPGMQNGAPVRVRYTMPITFTLQA